MSEKTKQRVKKRNLFIATAAAAVIVVGIVAYWLFATYVAVTPENVYTSAEKHWEDGNPKKAYEELKRLPPQENYEYYLMMARGAYLAGDKLAAKKHAQQGLKVTPRNERKVNYVIIEFSTIINNTYVSEYKAVE